MQKLKKLKHFYGLADQLSKTEKKSYRSFLDLVHFPNARDSNGNTALHHLMVIPYAVTWDKPKYITAFVKAGGNVLSQNNDGMTALMLALLDYKVATPLIICEVNGTEGDYWNDFPDEKALDKLNRQVEETINILLDYQIDLDMRNAKGEGFMHLAKRDLLPLLKQRGVDVNMKTPEGKTKFMVAVFQNEHQNQGTTVRILGELGADVNVQDNEGNTVGHFLTHEGIDADLIHWLPKMDLTIKNKAGDTPLDLLNRLSEGHTKKDYLTLNLKRNQRLTQS